MIRGSGQHSVREIENFNELIKGGISLNQATVQNIDFTEKQVSWHSLDVKGCTFLGCTFKEADINHLHKAGAILFPRPKNLPYLPFRSTLYTWQELLQNQDGLSRDLCIYKHFSDFRFSPSINEALYQRIHDHAIDDALRDFLKPRSNSLYVKKCVGIMGGHGTSRSDYMYLEVAKTSHQLSKMGFLVVSGGGPGTMEAANLGAYLGMYEEADVIKAVDLIKSISHYSEEGFTEAALEVVKMYPRGTESLAIPTWFYGHEPSNVFATHIAKYFSNSIREDNLIAICLNGIIFAPGSAGTTQEIFQDAAQNHYVTHDYISPMVLLGKKRYTEETDIYKTLSQLSEGRPYSKYIFLTDSAHEASETIKNNPPFKP